MGKPILWSADRVQTNENNRFVSDTNITNWNNKLENIIVTDWNNAITSGFYNALAGATNAPDTSVALSGYVITSGNLIIQQLYPEDNSTEELIYYIRKGFNNNGNITWSKWFITNLYMEEYIEPYNLTPIIKGADWRGESLFRKLIPYSVRSIIFTDIKMPSDATLIDADDDGDGGVVAWVDSSDNKKMYVSTQYKGVKVEGNSSNGNMFATTNGLTSLDLSNFDTSKVSNMSLMFYRCINLTTLDLSNFDTSKVSNMKQMFDNCRYLTSLDLSNFDTSKVANMKQMFSTCTNLTSLDLSSFNTSNVTDMGSMFNGCTNLTSLDLSSFNTSNVTDMGSMFNGCTNLTSLDLSSFNTSNVTDMSYMFSDCSKLATIKVGDKFKWICTLSELDLSGTWQDETGTQYTSSSTFPSNVAHTYTKVS